MYSLVLKGVVDELFTKNYLSDLRFEQSVEGGGEFESVEHSRDKK